MKKLVSLMLAALMLFAMVPAVAESTLTGTWYLVEVIYEGQSQNPSALDMSASIVLNEDGSAQLLSYYKGTTEDLTAEWVADGNQITITEESGLETKPVLEGDRLNIYHEYDVMSFSQDPEAASVPAIQPVAAENEEDFLGYWTLAQAETMGVMLPAEKLGMSFSLAIEPGQATIDFDGMTETDPTAFQDGQLKFRLSAGTEMTLVLNDNGQLSTVIDSTGQEVILYFAKTEE